MGDVEDVAEWVAHHCPSIAVRGVDGLEADGSGIECPPIHTIGVANIDVEKGRKY